MFNFLSPLSLIPTQYKILIAVIALAAYTLFVFNKGANYELGKIAVEQNELIQKAINDHNALQVTKLSEAVASMNRLSKLDTSFNSLKSLVEHDIKTKIVFQNKDCKLDDESLRLFNGEVK